MLTQGLHALVFLILLAQVVVGRPLWPLMAAIAVVGVTALAQWRPKSGPPWAIPVTVGAALLVINVSISYAIGFGLGSGLLVGGGILILAWRTGGNQIELTAMATSAVPALLMWAILMSPAEASAAHAALLLAWMMAMWPAFALISHGRKWMLASCLGLPATIVLSHYLLGEVTAMAPPGTLPDLISLAWSEQLIVELAIQLGLVVGGVGPLLFASRQRWRWLWLGGAVIAVVPPTATALTGPWQGGWPIWTWIFSIPGGIALAAASMAMLITTRRGELLHAVAARAMSIGCALAAIKLLPLVEDLGDPLQAQRIIAMSLVPLLWGSLMAGILGIAAVISDRQRGVEVSTTQVSIIRQRIFGRMRRSAAGFGSGLAHGLRDEGGTWLAPSLVVPGLILLSAWPVYPYLSGSLLMVGLVPIAAAAFIILRASQLLWALAMATILAVACLATGLDWPRAAALAAVGLIGCLAYVRWPRLGSPWAFPTGLLIVAPICGWWNPTLFGSIEPILAAGLAGLVANTISGGYGRLIVLGGGAAVTLAGLSYWATDQDPYATLQFMWTNSPVEIGRFLGQVPALAMVLLMVWVTRIRLKDRLWRAKRWQQVILMATTTTAAATWAVGWRAGIWSGLLSWAIFLAVLPWLLRELRSHAGHWRAGLPIPEIAALALAAVLASGGNMLGVVHPAANQAVASFQAAEAAAATAPIRGAVPADTPNTADSVLPAADMGLQFDPISGAVLSGQRLVKQEALGTPLLELARDLIAILVTGLGLILIRQIIAKREVVVDVVTMQFVTERLKRRKTQKIEKAKAKAIADAAAAANASDAASNDEPPSEPDQSDSPSGQAPVPAAG